MIRRTLAEAIAGLRASQRAAILTVINALDGQEHIDDLAFVVQVLEDLTDVLEHSPVGWCIVHAHRHLLEMARNEGLIPRDGERKIDGRGSRWDELHAQLAASKAHAHQLQQELATITRQHDTEIYQLRCELREALDDLAKARSTAFQAARRPPPTGIPGPGVLARREPGILTRLWRRMRGRT
jgi:hypothetical protein